MNGTKILLLVAVALGMVAGHVEGATEAPPPSLFGKTFMRAANSAEANAALKENRVLIFEGDSTTAGAASWPASFQDTDWGRMGVVDLQTNIAVSSDGAGMGHPDNVQSYRTINTIVIDGSGVATATLSSSANFDIRKFMITSASVPAINGVYTITPVGSPWTQFTFQTTGLAAQTINGGQMQYGAVSRYAKYVRSNKPQAGQTGYYFLDVGLNDAGVVLQAGDLSGLNTYWAPAMSNLMTCARADGFKVVAYRLYNISAVWQTGNRASLAVMNDWITNAKGPDGKPLWDYLVDLEAVFPNPFDTRYLSDGLHPTAYGYKIKARAVAAALQAGTTPKTTLHPEVYKGDYVAGTKAPENLISAPVGTVYAQRSSPPTLWFKKTGSGNTGWVQLLYGDLGGGYSVTTVWTNCNVASGSTNEAGRKVLFACPMPAGIIGANGLVEVKCLWSSHGAGGNRYATIKFDSTDMLSTTCGSGADKQHGYSLNRIYNRANAAVQVCDSWNGFGYNPSATYPNYKTFNTGNAFTLSIDVDPTANQTNTLESVSVEITHRD